jgi:hypothetical protein
MRRAANQAANQNDPIDFDSIEVPEGYTPSEDEEYMNPVMQAYFKRELTRMKAEKIESLKSTRDEAVQNAGNLENFGSAARRSSM